MSVRRNPAKVLAAAAAGEEPTIQGNLQTSLVGDIKEEIIDLVEEGEVISVSDATVAPKLNASTFMPPPQISTKHVNGHSTHGRKGTQTQPGGANNCNKGS